MATYLIISAAQVGQPEVIRLLAEWDADMEESDSIRRGRPLMHAANNGHTAAVKALVDCGANPEATDDNGYTALMVAVFSDRQEQDACTMNTHAQATHEAYPPTCTSTNIPFVCASGDDASSSRLILSPACVLPLPS